MQQWLCKTPMFTWENYKINKQKKKNKENIGASNLLMIQNS